MTRGVGLLRQAPHRRVDKDGLGHTGSLVRRRGRRKRFSRWAWRARGSSSLLEDVVNDAYCESIMVPVANTR
jgi:hypothetical protein